MPDYDAVVIGAGNGGLTAATTLARNGVRTLLLEQHNVPGGAATSFIRGRFEFEVALHQLSGFGTEKKPGHLRALFDKLGVLDQLEFVQEKEIYRTWVADRLDITLPADRQQTVDALVSRFPAEADGIRRLFGLIYQFAQEMFQGVYGKDPEFSAEKYPVFCNYALQNCQAVLNEFVQDPLLQLTIASYWGYVGQPPSKTIFLDLALMLFGYIEYKPFHIKGGSQALSQALLNRFTEAGGTARFNCGAQKIIVRDSAVKAVVTENGEEIETDHVISNASMITTYIDMIGTEHLPEATRAALKPKAIGPSAFSVYCGLDCEPADIGIEASTTFVSTTGNVDTMIGSARNFDAPEGMCFTCYDVANPEFSPPGCCQVAMINITYADHWLTLPTESYHETKYRYASQLVDIAERMHPGFRNALEEAEVATPLTHMNYLRTPGGAIYGFERLAKDNNMFLSHRPAVGGLYFAGAWASLGGFQPTLESGAQAARAVIKSLN